MPLYINQEQIEELKALIRVNKLPKFFEAFKKYCDQDPGLYGETLNELFLQENNFNRLQLKSRKGTISEQDHRAELSKLIDALLKLLDDLPDPPVSEDQIFEQYEKFIKIRDELVLKYEENPSPDILKQIEDLNEEIEGVKRNIKRAISTDLDKTLIPDGNKPVSWESLNSFVDTFRSLYDSGPTDEPEAFAKTLGSVTDKIVDFFISAHFRKLDADQSVKESALYDDLFERIVFEEKLSHLDLIRIKEVLDPEKRYSDEDRTFITTAISLGVIRKYNSQKLSLLVDIINDGDEVIWQRALVGLMLGVRGNEWPLFWDRRLTRKLKLLELNPLVQIGIKQTHAALQLARMVQTGLKAEFLDNEEAQKEYKKFLEELREQVPQVMDFFSRPQHWFRPVNLSRLVEAGVPIEFIRFVESIQLLPNSVKHFLLFAAEFAAKEDIDLAEFWDEIPVDTDLWDLLRVELLEVGFFANVQILEVALEYWLFYNFFPEENFENIFQARRNLGNTKLLNLISSKNIQVDIQRQYLRAEAVIHHALGDANRAIKDLKKVIRLRPDDFLAWNNLGNAYYRLDRYEESIPYYEKAVEIKPDYHHGWNNLGAAYYRLDRYEESIPYYEKAVEIKPDYHHGWNNLGNAYYRLDRYEESIPYYEKAVEIKPDYHHGWNNLGDAYYRLDRYEESIPYYEKAVEIKPDYHHGWNNLGAAYYRLDRYEESIPYYEKAVEIKPDYHHGWNNLGTAYYALDRDEESIPYYEKAVEIKPDYHHGWNNLGNAYYRLDRYEESIPYYEKAVEIKPDSHIGWNNLGNAYYALDRDEESIPYYEKAVEIKPDYHIAWNNLGNVYARIGQIEKSLSMAKKAISLKEDYSYGWASLAWCNLILNEFEAAFESLEKSWSIEGQWGTAMTYGAYFMVKGDFDLSLSWYRKGLELVKKRKRFFERIQRHKKELAQVLGENGIERLNQIIQLLSSEEMDAENG